MRTKRCVLFFVILMLLVSCGKDTEEKKETNVPSLSVTDEVKPTNIPEETQVLTEENQTETVEKTMTEEKTETETMSTVTEDSATTELEVTTGVPETTGSDELSPTIEPTTTVEPTVTSVPTPTATNTPKPTATNTPKPTATNTPKPTATSTPKPTATNTPKPTNTPTPLVSGNLKPGDTIVFGRMEQDTVFNNGTEPIEWIVLDVQGDQAFIVSRYALYPVDSLWFGDEDMLAKGIDGCKIEFSEAEKKLLVRAKYEYDKVDYDEQKLVEKATLGPAGKGNTLFIALSYSEILEYSARVGEKLGTAYLTPFCAMERWPYSDSWWKKETNVRYPLAMRTYNGFSAGSDSYYDKENDELKMGAFAESTPIAFRPAMTIKIGK